MGAPKGGFEYLEHTADVGIRSWGTSTPEAFEQAGLGLATLMGAVATGTPARTETIRAEGADLGGLLVAFLNEVVFVCESAAGEGVVSLHVTRFGPVVDAVVELATAEEPGEGLAVKAATYHQLEVVERADGSAETRVYLDV